MALSGVGFLKQTSDKARAWVDDPGASAKVSDSELIDMMRDAFGEVSEDVNRVTAGAIRARLDITLAADQREYALPPLDKFLEFKKLDTNGNIEWEFVPHHPLSPHGPGFTIEGPMLRLDPIWKIGETLRLEYIPDKFVSIFEATSDTNSTETSLIDTPASVTEGAVDARNNAYLGYVINFLTSGKEQQRVIKSQTNETQTRPQFTFAPDASPALSSGGGEAFEVVPLHGYRFQKLIALRTARFMASITADIDRVRTLQMEYKDALRALRLNTANMSGRTGRSMPRVIRGRGRWGKTI